MATVGVRELKNSLSKYLRRVAEGIDLAGLEPSEAKPLPLDARVDLAQLAELADIDLEDLL